MTQTTLHQVFGFVATLCLVAACDDAPAEPNGDAGVVTSDGGVIPPGTDGGIPPGADAGPPPGVCPPDAEARFDAVVTQLEAALSEHDVPGASIVVVCGRETVMTDALGTLERGGSEPVNADTRFMLGSTAKMFTAALALSLRRTGRSI